MSSSLGAALAASYDSASHAVKRRRLDEEGRCSESFSSAVPRGRLAAVPSPGSRKRGRREAYCSTDKAKWRQQLLSAKSLAHERGDAFSLRSWIHSLWPDTIHSPDTFGRRRQLCYNILGRNKRMATTLQAFCPGKKGRESRRSRAKAVAPSKRKRTWGGGRKVLAPDIGHELLQWFIDTHKNVQGRITNGMLLCQARIIRDDLREALRLKKESGHHVPAEWLRMPKINDAWISLWRREWRISWRATTICFKVSRQTLKRRLGILWRNAIRLRALHRKVFPGGRLRFRSYDQKPMWFNAAGGQKTLAYRGSSQVFVKENHHATRQRFTALTKSVQKFSDESFEQTCASSSNSGDPRTIAVLFKAVSGTQILRDLDVPPNVTVQFAPKGSYRLEQWVEWLEKDLGHADAEEFCECVVYDYYAPHLDPAAHEVITSRGHCHLAIGGGCTPWAATLDTHYHAGMEGHYRRAETHDATVQLRRSHRIPVYSRQTVLYRANDAWRMLDHESLLGLFCSFICHRLQDRW
jgi:hypothetical protein